MNCIGTVCQHLFSDRGEKKTQQWTLPFSLFQCKSNNVSFAMKYFNNGFAWKHSGCITTAFSVGNMMSPVRCIDRHASDKKANIDIPYTFPAYNSSSLLSFSLRHSLSQSHSVCVRVSVSFRLSFSDFLIE